MSAAKSQGQLHYSQGARTNMSKILVDGKIEHICDHDLFGDVMCLHRMPDGRPQMEWRTPLQAGTS